MNQRERDRRESASALDSANIYRVYSETHIKMEICIMVFTVLNYWRLKERIIICCSLIDFPQSFILSTS